MLYDPMEEKLPVREILGGFMIAVTLIIIVVVGMLL